MSTTASEAVPAFVEGHSYRMTGVHLDADATWVALMLGVDEYGPGLHRVTITHALRSGERIRFRTQHPIQATAAVLSPLPPTVTL